MNECLHCGEQLQETDDHCPFCGAAQMLETEDTISLGEYSRSALRSHESTIASSLSYMKNIFHENTIFMSGCLLVSLITLVVMPPLGIAFALGSAALLIAPIFVMVNPSINYFETIKHRIGESHRKHQEAKEAARLDMLEKEQTQAQSQFEDTYQLDDFNEDYEEAVSSTRLQPRKTRKSVPQPTQELHENSYEEPYEPYYPEPPQPVHSKPPLFKKTAPVSQYAAVPEIPRFKVRKKGRILNPLLLGGGCVGMFALFSFISGFLGLPGIIAGAPALVIGGMIFLFNLLFYLPTFVYHASFFGKIWVFILNTLFGLTGIGWVLLLIHAFNKNRAAAYRQEMRHYQKFGI